LIPQLGHNSTANSLKNCAKRENSYTQGYPQLWITLSKRR
jgi:hypothetical protein